VKICGRNTELIPEVWGHTAFNAHGTSLAVNRSVKSLDFAVYLGDMRRGPDDGNAVLATPFHEFVGFQFPVVDNVGPDSFAGVTFRLKLPGAQCLET
jgi:hypothetical protein